MLSGFIIGFICATALAYFERREMRDDYRQLVNEFSVRTGGRKIYSPKVQNQGKIGGEPEMERGEFAIFTPSMAEEKAEEDYERAQSNGEMSKEDLEYLQRTGVLPR